VTDEITFLKYLGHFIHPENSGTYGKYSWIGFARLDFTGTSGKLYVLECL
jgi:hypothetical protein